VLADVFGKKPENQIAVLLKQGIFTTISPVGVRVAQMLILHLQLRKAPSTIETDQELG
jgi:hypothetical protein